MKINLSVLSVFLLGLSGNINSDPSLLGTWQSNAELTINSIESVRDLSPKSREAYGRVFGLMKLTFSENSVVIEEGIPGAEEFTTSYRITSSGPDHFTVEFGDPDDPVDTAKYLYEDSCIKREFGVGDTKKGAFEYWCKVE